MNESAKLNEEKLFECFKSLNVPVHNSELKTPTKDFLLRVFDTFLSDLHINIGNHALLPFECISHIENPELYEEGQRYSLLLVVMNNILKNFCHCPVTVTLTDIVAPKPKKTKKILNYLVVFWNYILQKQELFSHVCTTLQPEIQKFENTKRECEKLEEEYKECLEKLNNIAIPEEELLRINDSKKEKIKKYETTQITTVNEYQQLKEKESYLQTEKVNIDLMFATNKETLSELDQLILSSPEKIKTDVQKLKDMIKDVDDKILEKEQEKKEKRKENQNKTSSLEGLLKFNAKMEKLHSEAQSLTELIQTLTSVNDKCLEEEKELQELQLALETKEDMANFYEKKSAKIHNLKMKQIEEINETYEMLQRQLSEEKQCHHSLDTSVTELEKNIDMEIQSVFSIVECCKKGERETQEYISEYKQQMLNIKKQFKEDCEDISKAARKKFKNL